MALDTPGVKCSARSTNYGYPIDCDWPFCGCDAHAVKVVRSLHECGWEDATALHTLLNEAHDILHKVLGVTSDRDAAHGEISELMRRIREATGRYEGLACLSAITTGDTRADASVQTKSRTDVCLDISVVASSTSA